MFVMVVALCDLLLCSVFFLNSFFGLRLLMASLGVPCQYLSGSPFGLLRSVGECSAYGWVLVFYTEQERVTDNIFILVVFSVAPWPPKLLY